MPTWWLWLVLVSSLLAGGVVGAVAYGTRRWKDRTGALTARLDAARIDETARRRAVARFDPRELKDLPWPVQRYFGAALTAGQPIVAAVDVALAGTFNLSATRAQWKPFTSRQRVVTDRPGFLWDAVVALLPGVAVRVHDAYIAGEGSLHAAVLGLATVADLHGEGEVARGELVRFFAEAAWYPTALLPSQGVHWQAVDDRSANATLVDGAVAVTLLFRFDAAGLIESVRAESRGAVVGKSTVMLPWEGRWSDYGVRDGMTVPSTGEVAWLWPDGRRPYFRGSVTSLRYGFVA